VSGLKGDFRIEVQASRPTNVSEAIGLTRLYEVTNWSLKKPPITEDQREAAPPLPSSSLARPRSTPTPRLSPAEMQD
jgi:hypothetical protein